MFLETFELLKEINERYYNASGQAINMDKQNLFFSEKYKQGDEIGGGKGTMNSRGE